MRLLTLDGVDPVAIEQAFDPAGYARGLADARERAVLAMEWLEADYALVALARGERGAHHRVIASFEPCERHGLDLFDGECDCRAPAECHCCRSPRPGSSRVRTASARSTRGRSSGGPTPSSSPGCGAGSRRWSSAAPRSRWPPTSRPNRSRCWRSS